MELDIEKLTDEVMEALASVDVDSDGDHLHSNYQNVVAWTLRLTEIHNLIALSEITGKGSPEMKKFRTLILDPSIERLEKVAVFESRKITARNIEAQLDR